MLNTSMTTSTEARQPRLPFRASDYTNDGKPHLLVASSGSVATIKLPNILAALSKHNISIRVILTPSASRFLQAQSAEQPSLEALLTIPNVEAIYEDADEWEFTDAVEPSNAAAVNGAYGTEEEHERGWIRGDPILHIELRKWADMMLIAPLSANMLAKIVGGMAEGLLSSVVRAWDSTGLVDQIRPFHHTLRTDGSSKSGCALGEAASKKRILVAPAMNTAMWRHPVTGRQIAILEGEWGINSEAARADVASATSSGSASVGPAQKLDPDRINEGWFEVLRPMEKLLACGDVGDGAMKDWNEMVRIVEVRLGFGD